ncbi:MAG: GDP-mannose 4,6-dehydratase, partial [Chloroflexota bacterium]|nr:GDP-mannose 4,6-dehydratase [Chloroflexota bacterium]
GNAIFNQANGGWQVCISNCDLEFLEELQRDAALFTNASSSITLRERPNAHQLVFSSHILHLLVTTLCGAHSYDKQVPDALYTLLDQYKQAFLDSYLRGDGNIQHYKTVDTRRFTTNSPKLAAGFGLLLSLMDLDYSISYRDFEDREKWRAAYSFNIVSTYDPRTECQYSEDDYEGFVYDLTVEGTHNFAAGIGNIVVHNTHVDRSILDPDAFVRTDVYGAYVLCEAAKDLKLERLHHISTDEVYGPIPQGKALETDAFRPTSPYAASKAGGELLVLSYAQTYKLPITITRGVNTYGPYQYPEKVIPLWVTNAIDNLPLPLYGDGQQVRDRLHTFDHARAVDFVLHHGTIGEAYNVAADCERTNIEIAELMLELLEKPRSLIQPILDRPAHDVRYALDTSKLRALGWQPQENFDQGFEATVRWYQENEWWWRPLKSGEYLDYYRKQYTDREQTLATEIG